MAKKIWLICVIFAGCTLLVRGQAVIYYMMTLCSIDSMWSPFKDRLAALIKARNIGLRELSRLAEPQRDEANTSSYISMVLKGKKPAPLDRVPLWADALELKGQERQEFLDAAALDHAPPEVMDIIDRLEKRAVRVEQRLDDIFRRLGQRVAEPPEAYGDD